MPRKGEAASFDRDDPRLRPDAPRLAIERTIGRLRVAVMISGTIVFPMIADRFGVIPKLGYGLLLSGWIYTLYVQVFEPYRRYPVLSSAWVTTPADVFMTLLWIAATGGVDSPWIVALFVVIAVASLRYTARETIAFAAIACIGYTAMAAVLGQLAARATTIAIHVFYLVVMGSACAVIARARMKQLGSHISMLDLTQEVAQVGSWEWSIGDGGLVWSEGLKRIFGVPEGSQPTLETFYAAVHPDDREMLKVAVENALAERSGYVIDHRIVDASGAVRWLHCRARVFVGDDGRPKRMIGSSQDVTEAREMQEQLLVGQKLASLGTLASGIAHEINNPLAYVSSSLAVARRELEASPLSGARRESLGAALDAAEDGCRRVAEIVRGLRSFSRAPEEGSRSVDLARVVDSALAIASHEIGQRARLTREYGEVPAVRGTESRLLQVVLNLVVNAAQAIDGGTKEDNEIRVRIDLARHGRVMLEVSDTGKGIPDEHMKKIFDPFFTTKPPGVGTGLGLSICHGIVRDLGGEVSVESTLGLGTTFRVVLPVASAVDPPEPPPRGDEARAPKASRRARILVVDDEVRYARSLSLLLGAEHDVKTAADGNAVLDMLARGERFDVVFCDLMMAGMDGISLHEALSRTHPELLPRMVFLTGGATTERSRAFLARSDVQHLEKPVEPAKLHDAIQRILHAAEGGEADRAPRPTSGAPMPSSG
jgi:PAS domain S-box-containing protein